MRNNTGLRELIKENEQQLQNSFKLMVLVDNGIDLNDYFKSELNASLVDCANFTEREYKIMGYKTLEIIMKKNLRVYNMNYAYNEVGDTITLSMQTLKNGKQWDMDFMNANAIKFNR